ncbi:MAG: hypothetical protein AMJ81_02720 [Phycisphaerae bacterium SM23_33]|nr:MAG: hypothetical protein AMJ81_02720 [Phycisphaerae bacterium SM23_33]
MPMVRYDDRSFIVDEQRIWLCSGSIHYFRVPHQLWRDRLLKARRAGLNCVQTYVAWNVHEQDQGEWDFAGDRDLRQFVTLAGELGLYVILRPGPYICAEWDFGGFPAWLASKSGVAYRTANATYMHYFDKYLGQVLPRLADLQVTRGGNIILIQNENEYVYTTQPDRLNYCQFISQLFRRAGFEIPIITCNFLTEPRIPETIECMNCWGDEVQRLKALRAAQPDAPMLVTEFWTGWFDHWGGPHQVKQAREVARRALEILGCGCQLNYYMWHGGTNFAFWGSRLSTHEASYQTTSYDYDAPLAEGGGLTEKYYLTKLVNMLGSRFGHVFAQGRMEGPGATVHSGTQALNVSGPAGRMVVVTNNGRDQIDTARISLPDGRELDVSLHCFGAAAIPVGVRLGQDVVLDYANLMPLGLFGESNLVLHGPAGWEGRISVNGREVRATVPEADRVVLLEHRGQRIVVLNSETAQRSWEVDGALVIGPEFVGETIEDVKLAAGTRQYMILSPEGRLTHKKVRSVPARQPTPPKLGSFSRICVCEEPINRELPWKKLDRPRDMAALGIQHGYGWYRLQVQSPRAQKRHLFLPDCEDRATIYLNKQWVGVWGWGPGAARRPIPADFRRGVNDLVFLVDNLGRVNVGPYLGQLKGIHGRLWEAKPLRTNKFKIREGGEFSRRMVPRMMAHMVPELEAGPMYTAEVNLSLPRICPVHLSYTGLRRHVMITCNGRQAGFFPNSGGYAQLTLGNELKSGKNTLRLLVWGAVTGKELEEVKLHLLTEQLASGERWSYRRWELPVGHARVVGKGLPAWYRSRFKIKELSAVPLFLRISGTRKGQILLNGHNVGRFWNIGPQEYYYLPEPWLTEDNELVIFAEQGDVPSGSRLLFRPRGPYRD